MVALGFAAPVAASAAAARPVIDRKHLARMTLGEADLEREVLALFDRQAGLLLARLRGVPLNAAAAAAHTLKGSARGIGAWGVADAAEAVELAADAPELAAKIEALVAAVDEASKAIAAILRAN